MEHKLIKIEKCPICENDKQQHFLSAIDHNVSGELFNIVSCNECNFKFTSPIPTEDTIGNYYKSENYISHSDTKKGIINYLYHIVRKRQLKIKLNILSNLNNNNTLLDIGCGTGEFLNYCKNKFWNVTGIEPDIDARKVAKQKHQLDILDSVVLYNLPKKSFSIITLWHVLEHVYNLNEDLLQFNKILINGGFIIIAVPNCNSYDAKYYKENWAAYDLPIHLYHFTKEHINAIAIKTGFTLVKTFPLFYDAFYISMLSEKKNNGNIYSAIYNGLKSNIKARKDNNYSSLIYILKKS